MIVFFYVQKSYRNNLNINLISIFSHSIRNAILTVKNMEFYKIMEQNEIMARGQLVGPKTCSS